jgi:flagellar FliL protein
MAEDSKELMPENLPKDEVEKKPAAEKENEEKRFSFFKVGLPVILIQAVVAYFLASNFIVPRIYGKTGNVKVAETKETKEIEEKPKDDFGQIYNLDEVIVNPADSQGMQFVLINFGFEVQTEKDIKTLSEREVQLRDIIIKILGAKTLAELDGPDDKENLRREVKKALNPILPKHHLLNVYFSNYIIQ